MLVQKSGPNGKKTAQDSQLWLMRWFILIIIAIGFLASIIASIITKNPLMAMPSSLVLIMRPVVRWLFPPN